MKRILLILVMMVETMITFAQKNIRSFWEGEYLQTVEQNILNLGNKITVEGQITGLDKGGSALNVHYHFLLNANWIFISGIIVKDGNQIISLSKTGNKWMVNDQEREDLDECEFIDLNISPFTNTLPINNLDFRKRNTHRIKVAYIDVFISQVTLSNQSYTKLDNIHFEYENLDSGFKRTIETDSSGLVVNYPGIWRRLEARSTFENRLIASAHDSSSIPEEFNIYNWLIGSWDARVIDYQSDGSKTTQSGEWHFSWVLEGRAIQDVWIVPGKGNRNSIETYNRYGTSIRVFNPEKKIWELTWLNPVTGAFDRLEGKKVDDELIHEGVETNGNLQQWIFDDITENSFHWMGKISEDGGKTWSIQAEFFLSRTE